MSRYAWWLLPILAASAAACHGLGAGSKQMPGAGGGGSTGSDSPSSTGSGSTGAGFDLQCDKPALGRPVIRLLNRAEFQNTLNDVFPEVSGQWTNSLPANTVSAYGFDNDGSAVAGAQYAGAVLDMATTLATALTGNVLSTILPCSTSSADNTCAETFLMKYGRRLFRRTLTTAEHDRYLTFFTSSLAKSDFKTALKWMTIGLIQSPNTLYRSEIGSANDDGTRHLSPIEVATELAYTYTGTTPTDALITQAESGSLGDPVALAKTMLTTDQGKQTVQRFFEGYLAYTRVLAIEKSNIPTYDDVRNDMASETRAFIDDIVFQKGKGLSDLLTAPTTNPSLALAQYYGFPSPSGDYAPIARPSGRGIGLLAQGSFLATHAQPNGSSPTQRGLLVFQRLLCETKPSPPPNVPQVGNPQPGVLTTRDRYEHQHQASGCGVACHGRFDPIGFGFEHFDEGGRYRATESGLTINSAADVPNPDGKPLFNFQGEEDLVQGLAQQPVIYQCFTAHLATYAFGTGDSCLGSAQVADFQAGKVGISDLYASLASAPHFTTRAPQ